MRLPDKNEMRKALRDSKFINKWRKDDGSENIHSFYWLATSLGCKNANLVYIKDDNFDFVQMDTDKTSKHMVRCVGDQYYFTPEKRKFSSKPMDIDRVKCPEERN